MVAPSSVTSRIVGSTHSKTSLFYPLVFRTYCIITDTLFSIKDYEFICSSLLSLLLFYQQPVV